MAGQLQHLTGEELLLTSILGGPQVQTDIDRELDRRALAPRPVSRRPRPVEAIRWRPSSRVA